jgi:hypothetical protein
LEGLNRDSGDFEYTYKKLGEGFFAEPVLEVAAHIHYALQAECFAAETAGNDTA